MTVLGAVIRGTGIVPAECLRDFSRWCPSLVDEPQVPLTDAAQLQELLHALRQPPKETDLQALRQFANSMRSGSVHVDGAWVDVYFGKLLTDEVLVPVEGDIGGAQITHFRLDNGQVREVLALRELHQGDVMIFVVLTLEEGHV